MNQRLLTPGVRRAGAMLVPILLTALLVSVAYAEFPLGRPAPAFRLRKPDGQRLTLTTLRGKVVLLDFWGPS
jgi:cytochrome oxidase Cu insertion factor (SCO1/SenC/PrrC family)